MNKLFKIFSLMFAVCLFSGCMTTQTREESLYVECYSENYKERDAAGLSICDNIYMCNSDAIVPYQNCTLPMPKYYDDYSLVEGEMMLIHPYTREIAICKDTLGEVDDCVKNFKSEGFVLLTDVPQMPAKYDIVEEGTYPARKWRNNGEIVPRW